MTVANDRSEPERGLTMSSVTGKLVLSIVRDKDYAHAGEEEAIELVLGPLSCQHQTRVLDVGCGIGGTASYVEARGWGKVTGVDLDPDNIELARERHPGVKFFCSDVVDLERAVQERFDVIYLFNAFFLFEDRPAALRAMRAVAAPGARLAIFDYVDRGGYLEWQRQRNPSGARRALELEQMDDLLGEAGWRLDRIVPAHAEYLRWYEDLVTRIDARREAIVEQSDEDFFEFVRARYSETRDDIRAGRLGGATLYGTAVDG